MTGTPSAKDGQGLDQALGHLRAGRVAEAAALVEKTFRADPENPKAHHVAGLACLQQGLSAEAAVHFEKAVSGDPENPDFRINFGVALNNLGRLDEAIGHNRKAISLNPGLPMAHANLGFALRQTGDYLNALDAFTRALELVPDHIGAQLGLVSILSGLRSREYSPEIEKALLQAFDSPFSDYAELGPAAACQLGLKYGLSAKPAPDADAHGEKAIAEDPLFTAFLSKCVNTDVPMELFLTDKRRRLLLGAGNGPPDNLSEEVLGTVAIVGMQCFINEYVFLEELVETKAVGVLKCRLEKALAEDMDAETIAKAIREPALLFGMYGPLSDIKGAENLVGFNAQTLGPELDRLIRLTLENSLKEQALKEKIDSLGNITDATSKAVRAQYEKNPYPRWLHAPAQQPTNLSAFLGRLFPHFTPPAFGDQLNVLIAGSGTGQHVAHVAYTHPDAHITAIDLSKASLAYAMRMTERMGITNVRFLQADILKLGTIGEDFDMIQSVGVLHHMKAPLDGWRVLDGLLKPGGVIKLGLYSDRGRRGVQECRGLIAREDIGSTPGGIARFRRRLITNPPAGDMGQVLEAADFFTTSMCRDLLFHVQESHTTPKRMKKDIEALGLTFIGFEMFEDAGFNDAYRKTYPDDSALTDLDNWEAFERDLGGLTDMYLIWCQKPEGA